MYSYLESKCEICIYRETCGGDSPCVRYKADIKERMKRYNSAEERRKKVSAYNHEYYLTRTIQKRAEKKRQRELMK